MLACWILPSNSHVMIRWLPVHGISHQTLEAIMSEVRELEDHSVSMLMSMIILQPRVLGGNGEGSREVKVKRVGVILYIFRLLTF
jgi:hypothetical protein